MLLPASCLHLGVSSYSRCVESMEKVLQSWEAHGMALSPDQALLLASRAELDATALPPRPVGDAAYHPSQGVMSNGKETE